MKDVYIIGSATTRFQKWPEKTFKNLTREIYLDVLSDAGMPDGKNIDFIYFGNCAMHHWGQGLIRGHVCLLPLISEGTLPERTPIINVEGACATASLAFHTAWKDVMSGQSHLVLALGVEKTFFPDNPDLTFGLFGDAMDNFDPAELLAVYKDVAKCCGSTFDPGAGRTVFMDTYATQACYHMWRYGTTQRQIAFGAAKNHHNATMNPKAQYQFEVPLEDVLNDRLVSYPLTRAMCAPIGDGAAAALLCSSDFLAQLPAETKARAVKVKSSVITSGKFREYDEPSLSHLAACRAYEMAGVKAKDIDVAEVHDATSFCEIYQAEMLGFCPFGRGGAFVESGATSLGGSIPINTSGGLVSKGHPIGATGLSMIYELCTQLRGEAGARQVPGARLALQENGGGVVSLEEAACSVAILEKDF